MLIVQIKPSAAKTLTLPSLQCRTCCEPRKRLVGILSPGLVPSMDYSISLRALDHTELYLDSQSESSDLQQGAHGCTPCHTQVPCHPAMGQALWELVHVPASRGWQERAVGSPCPVLSPQAPAQSPSPSSSFRAPLEAPIPLIRFSVCLLLERSLMPKHLPSPAPCNPCAAAHPQLLAVRGYFCTAYRTKI